MAQFGRPNATQAAAGCTPNGAATAHQATDETVANDATDFVIGDGAGNPLRLGLSSVTDPQASTGHVARMRAQIDDAPGSFNVTFRLKQGSTVIATKSVLFDIGVVGYFSDSINLSEAEADAITNYGTLNLEWIGPATGELFSVTWGEFEVPDAPAGQPAIRRQLRTESGREGVQIA